MGAQHAHRQIKRHVFGAELRGDRHGCRVHIGDHPEAVAPEQIARLPRNIGGGIAQTLVRFEPVALVLGNHLAAFIGVKAIDHHPVITQHLTHQSRSGIAQHLRIGRAFELRDDRHDHADMVGEILCGVGFELDHRKPGRAVHRAIEQRSAAGQIQPEPAFQRVDPRKAIK